MASCSPVTSQAADLNFIPGALIKRVDVLTGGASSVYGADAVAGVVNFIMDTGFTGVRFDGQYSFPLTHKRNLRLSFYGGAACVDYLNGLEQPGSLHSGAGGGLSFISPHGVWMATVLYAHGFEAIRHVDERGANQIGLIFQWDMEAKKRGKSRFFTPEVNPYGSRGGERLFR